MQGFSPDCKSRSPLGPLSGRPSAHVLDRCVRLDFDATTFDDLR
jgi:hypothetical protein